MFIYVSTVTAKLKDARISVKGLFSIIFKPFFLHLPQAFLHLPKRQTTDYRPQMNQSKVKSLQSKINELVQLCIRVEMVYFVLWKRSNAPQVNRRLTRQASLTTPATMTKPAPLLAHKRLDACGLDLIASGLTGRSGGQLAAPKLKLVQFDHH